MTQKIIEKLKRVNKSKYDENTRPLDVKLGDGVYVEIQPYNKFKQVYEGPFEVVDVTKHPNIIIKKGEKLETIHKNRVVKK